MRSRRILIAAAVVLVVLLWLVSRARPQVAPLPVDSDNIVFEQSYRLGDTAQEDLVVWAETIQLESSSRVNGDAALIGKMVRVAGVVGGELTAAGDEVAIDPESHIVGDAVLMGREVTVDGRVDGALTITGDAVTIAPTARVRGEVIACADSITDAREDAPAVRPCADANALPFAALLDALGKHEGARVVAGYATSDAARTAFAVVSPVLTSLVLSGLAALTVTLFPGHISRIEEAMLSASRRTLTNGVLAFLAVIGVGAAFVVVLAVAPPLGILLLPVLALAALGFLAVLLVGLMTLAVVLGGWLLGRISAATHPPLVTAAVGSVILSLLLHIPVFFPYGALLSLLAVGLLGVVAVGAALTTRLGTRSLHRSYFVQG